jgi:hypothetical protein
MRLISFKLLSVFKDGFALLFNVNVLEKILMRFIIITIIAKELLVKISLFLKEIHNVFTRFYYLKVGG